MNNGDEFPEMFGTPVRRSKSGKATRVFHEDGTSEFFFAHEDELLEQQLFAFRSKFGRDPENDEPFIFDPLEEDPTPLGEEGISRIIDMMMDEVGVHPSLKYAWEVTGKLVTEENRTLLTPTELAEWYCVIHDWERNNPEQASLDELALDEELTEDLAENLAYYNHLRTLLKKDNPVGHITLDVLHIATTLMAGKAPVSAYMLSNLAFQTSNSQIETFVMVGGTLIKAALESGAFQRDPELVDTVSRIAETFNVDTEAVRLLNDIDMASKKFTVTGDDFTIATTVASVIAGMIACDVLPEQAVMIMLETDIDDPDNS